MEVELKIFHSQNRLTKTGFYYILDFVLIFDQISRITMMRRVCFWMFQENESLGCKDFKRIRTEMHL